LLKFIAILLSSFLIANSLALSESAFGTIQKKDAQINPAIKSCDKQIKDQLQKVMDLTKKLEYDLQYHSSHTDVIDYDKAILLKAKEKGQALEIKCSKLKPTTTTSCKIDGKC